MSDDRRPGLVPDVGDPDPPTPETQLPAIVAFLLDRLAEDEHTAWAARFNNGRWHRTGRFAEATSVARDFGPDAVAERVGSLAWDDNGHIARHDPARVLADVAAKRRIIDLHAHCPEQAWDGSNITGDCRECIDEHYPCGTLRLLALPFADHPDYREEWRP